VTEIDRRQLLIRGGGAIGGLSMSGLLAGCFGGSDSKDGAATDGGGANDGEPKQGGTLRFSHTGTPAGYDPHKWWNAQTGLVATACCEPLIGVHNYTGERVPRLATAEPEANGDATVFTYALRPDVKFHGDHGTMTADDVKFSWERLLSPDLGAEAGFLYASVPILGLKAFQDGKAKGIRGLRAVDDLTFEVTLERPDSTLLPAFSYMQAVVVPRAYYEGKKVEDVNWAPIGTGPFMLESVDKATGGRLVRNPEYWDPALPYVDAVEISYNVEPALAISRIQKGEQELMNEPIPAAQVNQIRNDPSMKDFLKEGIQNTCQWLALPTRLKPFDQLEVRQAVAMAIDKEKLAKVVKGLADPATGGIFSPKSRYFEDGIAYPYDPEKARALLAEAGFADGFDAPFWYQNQPPWSDMGPAITQDLEQIGIRVQGKSKIYDQFVQETNPGPPAMIIFAWEDAYGHGSYVADSAFTKGAIDAGCCNYSTFTNAKLEALTEEGHVPDRAASDEAYKEISRIVVADEVLWVPLLYPRRADLVNKTVRGYEVAVAPSSESKPFSEYWLAT